MDPQARILVLLVCFTTLLCNGVEGGRWNISFEEDLEFERQLKSLNKLSIKSIFTVTGEIFDCVDFYKQPAFDHALLNNYTIEYKYKARSLHTNMKDPSDIRTMKEECPIGSVPIKRMTKKDLMRERRAFKVRNLSIRPTLGTHYAVVRTKPDIKVAGAGSIASVWKPQVSGKQYSAGRLKIVKGFDAIEVGWRVDPTLYGDYNSHFYTRTDAGKSHCFDSRCGFVVTDPSLVVHNPPSKRGGPILNLKLHIMQYPETGDWHLELDDNKIGFWPKSLFTRLGELGTTVEWGGEVFSPVGTPTPVMGAGTVELGGTYYQDASFRLMSLFDGQKLVNAGELDTVVDSNNYLVIDKGFVDHSFYNHYMLYGGSASPSA